MDRNLTRNEYDVPNEDARRIRWAATLGDRWFKYLFTLPFLFGSIWVMFYDVDPQGGEWAVWGVSVVVLAIYGWAARTLYKNPAYSETHGLFEVHWEGAYYYVPWGLIRAVVDAVEWNYEDAGEIEGGEWPTIWGGTVVDVMKDPPSPPQNPIPKGSVQLLPESEEPREIAVDGETIGVCYPSAGYIQIYGPYLLQLDAFGFELSHLVDHYLFPGRPESEDVEWGRLVGVRPLEWPDE